MPNHLPFNNSCKDENKWNLKYNPNLTKYQNIVQYIIYMDSYLYRDRQKIQNEYQLIQCVCIIIFVTLTDHVVLKMPFTIIDL